MPLKEAVAFLKGAVARSLPADVVSQYVFADGVVYAASPGVLAAHPVPHILGTFGLAADDLEGALGRMASEPAIGAGDGTLILRSGRLRSSIDLFAAEPPPHALDGGVNWMEPPAGLLSAVATALPFAKRAGTPTYTSSWQCGVEFVAGFVRAISNRHGCAVDVAGLEVDGPTALTDDAAGYLAGLREEPDGWLRGNGGWMAFRWPSGAWVRCQLMAQEWPAVVDRYLADAGGECPVAVTYEWREAFADIKSLGEGTVDICPDAMIGRSLHADHRAEFATGVTRETRWSLKALANVLAVAEAWDPDAQGKPAAFRGKDLHGVVMGMSR